MWGWMQNELGELCELVQKRAMAVVAIIIRKNSVIAG